MQDDLQQALEAALAGAPTGYRVARGGEGQGYQLTGTVSRLDAAPEGEDEVKLTLATWPQKNLRHVLSAKASAKVKRTANRAKIHEKLLQAAAARVVADAVKEIGGRP